MPRCVLGMEAHRAVAHDCARRRRQLVHAAEPLQRHERLDARAAAVAVPDGVAVGRLRPDQPALAQVRDDALLRLVARQAGIALARLRCHAPVESDHLHLGQPVPAPHLEVVRVVGGRDLERAGAESDLDVLVGHHRHPALSERHDRETPDEVRVALVGRVHAHPGVAEHRHRAHRGRGQVAAALERIVDLVEHVVDVLVPDLEIADRRLAARAPVDHAVVAEQVAAPVELDEHLAHGALRTARPS